MRCLLASARAEKAANGCSGNFQQHRDFFCFISARVELINLRPPLDRTISRPTVIRLLGPRRPSKISRLVAAAIVDPIKSPAIRTWPKVLPDVLQECRKGITPRLVDCDTPAAIVLVRFVRRVKATSPHAIPKSGLWEAIAHDTFLAHYRPPSRRDWLLTDLPSTSSLALPFVCKSLRARASSADLSHGRSDWGRSP